MTIEVDGTGLTIEHLVAVARHGERVKLALSARDRMTSAREVIEDALASGDPVYGLTTGVAERKRVRLRPADRQRFSQRLVLNHRVAQSEPAPSEVRRGAMLCLASSYAKGVTGVRPELCEMIITLLNEGFVPRVRSRPRSGENKTGVGSLQDHQVNEGKDPRPCLFEYVRHEAPAWPNGGYDGGDEDAARVANNSRYRLSSYIQTQDPERAWRLANRMKAGTVNIGPSFYLSPDTPFGGYGISGVGREHGEDGFREYLQAKTIATPAVLA